MWFSSGAFLHQFSAQLSAAAAAPDFPLLEALFMALLGVCELLSVPLGEGGEVQARKNREIYTALDECLSLACAVPRTVPRGVSVVPHSFRVFF